MVERDTLILIDSISAFVAAFYSLAYVLRWRNGKSITSIISFFVFGYLGLVHSMAFFDILDRLTYGYTYIRPALPLVYGMIVAHVYIDGRKNIVNRADFERRLWQKLKRERVENV